ncbi:TPA: hypothetical protein R1738_001409, partial [Campylobacter lari]|nr:hypothetical protein [Campylobacter lari]
MTCYLHIGTPKTGTTSIQSFLYKNKELLNNKGYYCTEYMTMYGRIHHRRLILIIEEFYKKNIKDIESCYELKKLKKEICDNQDKAFILSDEGLTRWVTDI